jgi:hypothetical protein
MEFKRKVPQVINEGLRLSTVMVSNAVPVRLRVLVMVTREGRRSDINEKQPKNAARWIAESRESGSNSKCDSFRQLPKHSSPRTRTGAGITIDSSVSQDSNALDSMLDRFDFSSKSTVKSRVHPQKARLRMQMTERGMTNDHKDKQLSNALLSITESLEFGSNITLESAGQKAKQKSPSSLTVEGTQIDRRFPQARNALRPITEM